MNIAKTALDWLKNGDAADLAVWIGESGQQVHSNRAGYCLSVPIKTAHIFIDRFKMKKHSATEDGILFAA